MRMNLCLSGVAVAAWVAGISCSNTSSNPNGASAGSAGAFSNAGASGSAPSGGSTSAGSGASAQGGSAKAGGAGSANGGAGSANVGGAGSANGGSANAAGTSQAGAAGLASNLDPNVCASVVYEFEGPDATAQRTMCELCCHQAQFDSFGAYKDKCMCGTSVPANASICPQSTAGVCTSCCNTAGYPRSSSTSTTCYCSGLQCASGGDTISCLNCCTEHGYLAWGGPDKCVCTN
jgi:hypothetical protein